MCPIAVVFAEVDLPYWTSKVEHIEAFKFLSGDASRDLVMLTFDLLTLNSCIHGGSRGQPCHQV